MSTHDYSQFRERKQQTVWHTLNRLLTILIFLAAAMLAVLYFLPEIRYLTDMKSRRAALQAEKARLSLEAKQNQRKENLLKNDPEYVETIARDKLDLMKPGETIIRMDTPSPTPSADDAGGQ